MPTSRCAVAWRSLHGSTAETTLSKTQNEIYFYLSVERETIMPNGLPDLGDTLPRLPSLGLGRSASAFRAPLTADQRESTGQSLLGMGKSGLSALLGALDYPGSLVRGVLAGKPGSSVTGRQLLEKHGVVRPGDKGWGAWGAGLAADIATDPFTYATLGAKGALTSGGQALQKAGHLEGWSRKALLGGFHDTESALAARGSSAADISHLRDAGQRIATPAAESAYQAATGQALMPGRALSGLSRWSVPFSPQTGFTLGTGRISQAVAGGFDKAGDFLKYGNPLSRSLNSGFDWRVGRATDANTQRAMANTVGYRKGLESQGRLNQYDVTSGLDNLIREHPQYEANILRAARISTEGTSPLSFLASASSPADQALFSDFLRRTKPLGDTIAGYGQGQIAAEKSAGLLTRDAADEYARYVGRQSTSARLAGTGPQFEHSTIFPKHGGANVHREDMFRNLPGGTDRLNDWANRHAGNIDRRTVAGDMLNDILADHAHVVGVAPTPQQFLGYEAKSRNLSRWMASLEGDKYLGKINTNPFFSHDLAGDVARRGSQHARTMSSARAVTSALATGARRVSDFAPGEQYQLLPRALKQLGLGSHNLGSELVGAGRELYRGLAPKGAGRIEPLVQGGTPYRLNKELKQWAIPQAEFDNLARSHAGWIAPEEAIKPIGLWDSATNAFKALTYPIWPASHVRNLATAAVNNLRTGTRFGDYLGQGRLMRGLEPDVIANAARREQFGHARIFGEGGPNLELAGSTGSSTSHTGSGTARQWSPMTPGTNEHGMGRMGPTGSLIGDTANLLANEGGFRLGKDIVNKARDWKGAPNPFGISGVFGRTTDQFAPVVAGRKLSSNIEDFMRGAQYKGLVRQGYSPEMAAEQIRKYHFDYQDLTPFEKHWMRRAVPFYTFARKNLPLQMETLASRPGAFSTPFKPAMVNRADQEYVPDYLSSGFVSPLGPEQDGKRRFLSSLGLPQEEAFKELQLWNGVPDLAGTAMHYASNLNPMIKGPLEQMADRQFFSGRKLSDLKPSATGSGLASLFSDEYNRAPLAQMFTQGISNSPLTRFATSLDKLADTKGINSNGRKPGWATALNLLTGARVTDVDLERQRVLEQRAAEERFLKSMPHISRYTTYYVRPEDKSSVTPEESLHLRQLIDMQARAKAQMARQRLHSGQQISN